MAPPTQPQQLEDFGLHSIVRDIKRRADEAARQAAEKAQTDAEAALIASLRAEYSGRTLFCYDQSHQNRFHQDPREWSAVAFSFEGCVAKMRPHIFQYHGEDRWTRIENQLNPYLEKGVQPSLEDGQKIVFQAGSYWYCFFCLAGDEFVDRVAQSLAGAREEDKRRADQSCNCCSDE